MKKMVKTNIRESIYCYTSKPKAPNGSIDNVEVGEPSRRVATRKEVEKKVKKRPLEENGGTNEKNIKRKVIKEPVEEKPAGKESFGENLPRPEGIKEVNAKERTNSVKNSSNMVVDKYEIEKGSGPKKKDNPEELDPEEGLLVKTSRSLKRWMDIMLNPLIRDLNIYNAC